VELRNQELRGATHFQPGGPHPRHEVATHVDPHAFLDHFFSTVG